MSRAETIGMGGLFLHTPDPPTEGSAIELLFDLKAGEVRARAIVRHRLAGEGMGVQFVQMQSADRARLNQFLSQCSAGKFSAESAASELPPPQQAGERRLRRMMPRPFSRAN